MVIEGPFYRLTPISESSPRFDLELLYDIGGKNPRKEFKVEGYGYPLEAAIERCRHYAVRKKFGSFYASIHISAKAIVIITICCVYGVLSNRNRIMIMTSRYFAKLFF